MKKTVILSEDKMFKIISECVKKVINEGKREDAVQLLVTQANEAYRKAYDIQGGDETPLMDKDGNSYGLASEIYIDGKGYMVFPFLRQAYGIHTGTEKIKVFTKKDGKIVVFNGDYFDEGWKDAKKLLASIIKDAERGIGYFKGFDPNWENGETPEEKKSGKEAIRNLNKQISRKVGTGIVN